MLQSLADKVVLITGASSGIGRATAVRLAQAGAKVVAAARNQDALNDLVHQIKSMGAEALSIPTDVRDRDQCRHAVDRTVEHFRRLDILICSAGLSMRTYFEGADLDAMEEVIRVNFFGTLYPTYYALPHIKRTRGSLVAVSSLTGKRGVPSYSIYGASKFAIQGLYDSLRLELKRDGVHVGVVAPGFVDTPLRFKVLGPDGKPWAEQPAPPFRIWPVGRCVERIVRLIQKRRARAHLSWFTAPLLNLDQLIGNHIGDWILERKFPPEGRET